MSTKEYSQIDPKTLKLKSDLLSEVTIQGKVNVEIIVFRQIERTNMSALQGEEYFASNVRLTLSYIPLHIREGIIARSDEYTNTTKRLEYKTWCGVPLGTQENPINGSPYEIEEEVIDWHKLFEIVLDTFNNMGLTWKTEKWNVDAGRVKKKGVEPNNPTPVFTIKTKETKKTAKKEVIRRCSLCGERIERGTGKTYKRKLLHITPCLETAKGTE